MVNEDFDVELEKTYTFCRIIETDLNRAVDLLKRYRQISPQPADLYLDNNEFLASLP